MYGARTHIISLSSATSHICIKRGGTTETYWPDSTGARAALGGMVVSNTLTARYWTGGATDTLRGQGLEKRIASRAEQQKTLKKTARLHDMLHVRD